jgi:ubiquinone biosynthesis protein
MLFGNLRLSYQKLLRILEIIWLVFSNIVSDWFTDTRMYRLFRRAKSKEEAHRRSTQARIRNMMEDLGPTFVKFGQILADRPDLVSEKLRRELKKLQASARPFDNEIAINLIEEELGGPLDVFFETFNPQCIASASIGQVYTGVLRSGEAVVIKIQRPGIYTKIKIDLILMKVLAARLVRRYPELASLNIISFIDEFGELIMKELNYHYEANNILRFTELLKDEPSFYAPKVHNEYTTKRILIMEQITGIAPDEIKKLRELGYDLNKIAENGCNILLKMILRHGVFHADPHPGNIFILPGNRICFIDYGMVAVLKTSHINFLADFTIGFASKSSKRIADALIELSGKKFFKNEDDLRFEVKEVINRHSYIPLDKVDISAVMLDCVALIVKYELHIPSSIYMLLKALATIQKFALKLEPDLSMAKILVPYAKDVVRAKFSPKRFVTEVMDVVSDYINLIKDFPGDMSEILYKAKQGKLVHEISLREDKQLRKTIRIFSMNLALGIATGLLLLCSTIVYVTGRDAGIARAGFTAALIMAGWLYIRSVRHGRPE